VISSPGIAAWIAHAMFWGLLLCGWLCGELDLRRIALFVILWLAGRLGLAYVPYSPALLMFSSFVAVLDIALVFVIFKGDVRIK
jgi:hypothetical protein